MLPVNLLIEFTERRANALLRGFVAENVEILTEHPELAAMLPTVRYRREEVGHNDWLTIDQLVAQGYGDCEDLAAAWAAVAYIGGATDAAAIAIRNPHRERRPPHRRTMHIVTQAWGQLWDPSEAALRREAADRGVTL